MPIDPDELVGPLITGWPLDGPAANWVLDLERGDFGDLRLRALYSDVVRLLDFSYEKAGQRRRGPASVRLHLAFEEDNEPPEDDDADMEYLSDIELAWDELLDCDAPAPARVPLVRLPSRSPVPCLELTFEDLMDAFGEPQTVYEDLVEWQRDGFFAYCTGSDCVLHAVGISALGLDGYPPLQLVKR